MTCGCLSRLDSRDEEILPFWRRIFMSAQARRKWAAEHTAYHEDPSSVTLLGEVPTHKSYRLDHGHFNLPPWARTSRQIVVGILVLTLSLFGVVHLTNVLINLGPLLWDSNIPAFLPHWGAPGYYGEGLGYPTNVTRDVQPIPCHSHNDYWRRVPLFDALHYGCIGVEADIWLFPSTHGANTEPELFVGHNTAALTPNRTFRNLYLNPFLDVLDRANAPETRLVSNSSAPNPPNGVWDEDPRETLVLLVDFKTDGPALWPVVFEQLETLRSRGYLSHWNGQEFVQGPVTIVATGNAPFDLIIANTTYRDIFFDAPLSMMYEDPDPASGAQQSIGGANDVPLDMTVAASGQGSTGLPPNVTAATFDRSNSYYASTQFSKTIGRSPILRGGRMSAEQLRLLRGQIKGAQRRGLKSRYWGAPEWPIGVRNGVWKTLVAEGADVLNVDDLRAATQWDWSQRRHRPWV
ncbi:hypothetical protein HDK64DRAFT_272342 [Phyllosticta capitalensis]